MSNSLAIEIDVGAAKAALEGLEKGFRKFSSTAEQGTQKALSAVKRLNDAMTNLRTVDAGKTVDSLTRLNSAMASLSNAANLKGIAAELRALATLDVARLESQLRAIGTALRSIQPPPGLAATVSQLRQLGSAASSVTGQVNSAAGSIRQLGSAAQQARGGIGALSGGLGSLRGTLTTVAAGFGLVVGAAGIGGFIKTSMDAAAQVNSFSAAMTSITGSSGTAAEALKWVDGEANRLAVNLSASREGFKNFAASALTAGQDMDAVKQTFSGVSTAARVLNLSADDTNGVFRALSQIASKGVVQMEELRGQIGDRMPGAISAMARALNVGQDQLFAMVKAGQVGADVLPKFAAELERTFGPGLAQALNTPEAQLQRLSNTMTQVASSFGTAFFTPLKDGFKSLSDVFASDRMQAAVAAIASGLGQLASGFTIAFAAVADVVARVGEALSNAYNNVVSWLQSWGLVSEGFSSASTTGEKMISTLQVVGIMLAGMVVVGTVAAGFSLLSKAMTIASTAGMLFANAVKAIMAASGPLKLILMVLASGAVFVAGKLGLFDAAAKQVAKAMPDASTAVGQFTGSAKDLKDKMGATVEKTEDFAKAQDKLAKGFETVQASATQLPGALGQLQGVVSTLNEPLGSVAKSSGTLGLMLESMSSSLPTAAAGVVSLGESASGSVEPLTSLNAQLTTMTPLSASLATSTPVWASALSGMTVPDLTGFAGNVTVLASQAAGLDATRTALGSIVSYLGEAAPALDKAATGLTKLTAASVGVANGFNAATLAGGDLVTQLGNIDSGANTLIGTMRALESAARDALRAAQAAQSSSSSTSGEVGSGRYGGMSESLPESLTAPMSKFNNAPAFADGTANTSRHLSKLPGGGIPSILHPNEAVIPLSRGRKVPVDLDLSMTAPARSVGAVAPGVDLAPTARALELVASSQTDIAAALSDTTRTAVPRPNEWVGVGFNTRASKQVGAFDGVGNDFVFNGGVGAGGSNARTGSDTVTPSSSSSGGGVTVVISEGAIQVRADDLDGFKRSEDQIVRSLAAKIQRATRRVQ